MPTLLSEFRPLPPQRAYLTSKAKIRGYGGAMGGGKSRTLCEDTFNQMLDYPGIQAVLARQDHTSIENTTKKTMIDQVVPPEVITRSLSSGGKDYIELWNGSVCHFIGLSDPTRWYSSELGWIGFDEAQEIQRDTAIRLITRLRQAGMPCRASFTFNPSSPGHWLQEWFIDGEQTEYGFHKDALYASGDADSPIGDMDFVFAKATDNIYLPPGYIEQTLQGLPERLRRRYLEGLWEFIEGNSFFEPEDLSYYQRVSMEAKPLFTGKTAGDPVKDFESRRRGAAIKKDEKCRFVPGSGLWTIWKRPDPGKRYVMAVDTSSGGSYDYSGIQIVCIEDFEQVAEFKGKIVPTELAIEAYRAGRVFGGSQQAALAIPEVTGGWGFSVIQELSRMHYPNTYTRKTMDRITKKWTDKLGWDTTANSRAHMLDTLYRVLSEREFGLYGVRTVNELATFVYNEKNKPEAQDGCNDDLVVALAIAVTVAVDRPRQVRAPKQRRRDPMFSATGYGA